MSNTTSNAVSIGPFAIETNVLYMIFYIVIAVAIVSIVYVTVGRVLRGLRVKGVVSRRAEELIKIATLILSILIVIPIAISSFIQYSLWFSIAVIIIVFTALVIALKPFIENSFSYLLLVSSGILRDGENIQININNATYEGRVTLLEGNFMEILTSDNRIIFIPYKHVLNAVIIKQPLQTLKFKLYVYGHGIDIDRLVNNVREILSKSRFVSSINDIRLLEVKEEETLFLIEVGLRAPRTATTFLSDIYKAFSKSITHRFRVEILEPL